MQYGLDSACLASLQAMPGFLQVFGYPDPNLRGGYGIDRTFQQLIGSLLTLGAFLSSITAGAFAHFFGRKPALWLACLLTAAGAAIQIGTTNWGVVYLGRLVLGIGNGFLVTFSNIYCAEAAPAHLRAVLVAFLGVGHHREHRGRCRDQRHVEDAEQGSYQIPLGIQFIVPALLAGKLEEGRKALEVLRSDSLNEEQFELEWVEMVKPKPEEFSGSWFLISYTTYFMVVSGLTVDEAFKYSVMKSCLGFVGVNLGIYLMRHVVGRRSIMMIGSLTQGLCMLIVAITATTSAGTLVARNCLIAFTSLYMFAYNAFVGAASYPVATELVSTRLRSWTVGSAISLGYFLAWLTGFCSPYFINPENMNWGAKYGYIWAGSNFACGIFFFLCLPELKGRTLEEIDELFERRISAWKFKTTKTHIMDEALKEVKNRDVVMADSKETVELVEAVRKA
ncbi:hypothetical protein NEMBOFW57_010960 [Staphylotrichum longicolle]|uniref:Major facilitator superfamily (MFS) profile domain-containing protein n=1 Tax=Staphylotrichum longicolle TaxID=669026 RepID=A0AAD4HUM7_9PEZI|nr:hypothetical protein NEMBOFW57_010960 [Staphylotrichum longicolle]